MIENQPDHILDSIVVSIPACHAGGRCSIPRRGSQGFLADQFTFTTNKGDRIGMNVVEI